VGLAPGPDPSPTPSRCCRPLPAPRPVVDHEPDRDDVRPSVSCCIAALPDQHSHALCQRAGIAAGPGRPLAAAGAWLNARARGSTARSTYRRGVLPLPIRRASIVTPPCPQVRVLESSLSRRRGDPTNDVSPGAPVRCLRDLRFARPITHSVEAVDRVLEVRIGRARDCKRRLVITARRRDRRIRRRRAAVGCPAQVSSWQNRTRGATSLKPAHVTTLVDNAARDPTSVGSRCGRRPLSTWPTVPSSGG
jgi:hypothetical protein